MLTVGKKYELLDLCREMQLELNSSLQS